MTAAVEERSKLPYVSLGLGVATVVLITVVSFIALALGVAAIATGLVSAGRTSKDRPVAVLGAVLGFAAIAFFVVRIL
jgi:hypothetical protein